MPIRYVGALVIQAEEPKQLADWYARYFDFDVSLEHQGGYFGAFETERGPFHFGIMQFQGDPDLSTPREVIITFRVDNFDEIVKRMKRDGNDSVAFAEDDDGRYAMFRDPEGNQVSVWGD